MKSFLLLLSTICIVYAIYINNGVDASTDITADHFNYIKSQIALRNNAVNTQLDLLTNNIETVFGNSDKHSNLYLGLSSSANGVGAILGVIAAATSIAFPPLALGLGIASGVAALSSAVLGAIQGGLNSSPGEVGYVISQGVKSIIDEEVSQYNVEFLGAIVEGIRYSQANFYKYKTEVPGADVYLQALDLEKDYIFNRPQFEKEDYQLDSVGIYALYANAHLLFLHDMVVYGPKLYGFNSDNVQVFVIKFNENLVSYREYFNSVDVKGLAAVQNKVTTSSLSNQDEWNLRNEYYNFMKLYVFDIVNYWDFIDPIQFPNRIFIENAHVTLSQLFGAPYNGANHLTSAAIQSYMDSQNAYQFRGKLHGIYYKNYQCSISEGPVSFVKYFGGKQYSIRDEQVIDTKFLGDTGSESGARILVDLSSKSIDSVIQYNARSGEPKSDSKDYHWGITVDNVNIGTTLQAAYKTKETIKYQDKVLSSVLPISYDDDHTLCGGDRYIVESAVAGFVNNDITNDNIVFEFTGSMVDAQKYLTSTSTSTLYSRDGYRKYKHSISIPANTKVTYKIKYSPYLGVAGNFNLKLDLKTTQAVVSNFNTKIYSSATKDTMTLVQDVTQPIDQTNTGGGIYNIATVQLLPTGYTYLTLQFSSAVYLQSLTFIPIA